MIMIMIMILIMINKKQKKRNKIIIMMISNNPSHPTQATDAITDEQKEKETNGHPTNAVGINNNNNIIMMYHN